MQSTPLQSTPIRDRRRILGEKDANACLSPANRKDPGSGTGTPVKRGLFPTASPKKLLPSPIFAGQKRTRDQVEESNVNSGFVQAPRSETVELSHKTSSQLTPIYGSKDQPSPATDAMVVHLLTPQQPDPTQNSNQSSTQKSQRTIPEDPDARKMFIQEKATLLRTRLKSAMRNVPDHQFDRRVSELEAHSRKCQRLPLAALSMPALGSSTESQTKAPRRGSTPHQSTPDLTEQPFPASTVDIVPYDAFHTPADDIPPRDHGSPMQLGSPPVPDYSRVGDGVRVEETRSPSQRGDAVDGLLKLMNTADRHDGSDS